MRDNLRLKNNNLRLEIMNHEKFLKQLDFWFLMIALSIMSIGALYYFGFQIPGIILIIFGIAAIIVGLLTIITSIYYAFFKKS